MTGTDCGPVGVVVLNWNGRAHLEQGIASLIADLREEDFVVVVDNGSRDDSRAWLAEHHPEIEVVALPENLRFSGGNNAGAARVLQLGANVVLLLNNDTVVEPGLMEAVANSFAADSRVGAVGVRIVYDGQPHRIWYGGGRLDLRWGWTTHRAIRTSTSSARDAEGPTDWITGCCLAVRGEAWTQLGGLDDDYYIYGEDVDLCLRIRDRDWRLHYTPRATLRHAVSSTVGGSASPFKAYHKVRSRWQLFARHGQGVLWPLGVLATDVADLLRAAGTGSSRAALAVVQAWWDSGPGQGRRQRYPAEDLLD